MSQQQKHYKKLTAEERKRERDERERQKQTREAAHAALEAQKKAKELTQAAAGAADPDERQKLLNEALEKEVEAETFGKTARYLQTGAFQGLCAGAGLGSSIGISLGVLTGTLVGGTTGIVTGGLGGGLGLTVGAAHGPFFSVGQAMGDGLRKITGDLPGWKATEEQKQALERMVYDVKEQERPQQHELLELSEGGGTIAAGKGYTGQRDADEGEKSVLQGGGLSMPHVPGITSKKKVEERKPKSKVQQEPKPTVEAAGRMEERYADYAGESVTTEDTNTVNNTTNRPKRRPNKINRKQSQTNTISATRTKSFNSQTSKASSQPRSISRTQSQTNSKPMNPMAMASQPPSTQRGSTRVQQHNQSAPVRRDSGIAGAQQTKTPAGKVKKKPRKLEIRSDGTKGNGRA